MITLKLPAENWHKFSWKLKSMDRFPNISEYRICELTITVHSVNESKTNI